MRSLHPEVACVERKRITALDAVPLEALQEELRHGCTNASIGLNTSAIPQSPSPAPSCILLLGAVGSILDLVQIGLRAARLLEIVAASD